MTTTDLKAFSHVVCIENGNSWGIRQALGSHHRDIWVGNWQYESWTPRSCRYNTKRLSILWCWNASCWNLPASYTQTVSKSYTLSNNMVPTFNTTHWSQIYVPIHMYLDKFKVSKWCNLQYKHAECLRKGQMENAETKITHHRMGWQEWSKVLLYTNRTHARTTTSMGDAKGLMQIQMADICTNVSWTCQANLPEHRHISSWVDSSLKCNAYFWVQRVDKSKLQDELWESELLQHARWMNHRSFTCAFMLAPSM